MLAVDVTMAFPMQLSVTDEAAQNKGITESKPYLRKLFGERGILYLDLQKNNFQKLVRI